MHFICRRRFATTSIPKKVITPVSVEENGPDPLLSSHVVGVGVAAANALRIGGTRHVSFCLDRVIQREGDETLRCQWTVLIRLKCLNKGQCGTLLVHSSLAANTPVCLFTRIFFHVTKRPVEAQTQ